MRYLCLYQRGSGNVLVFLFGHLRQHLARLAFSPDFNFSALVLDFETRQKIFGEFQRVVRVLHTFATGDQVPTPRSAS